MTHTMPMIEARKKLTTLPEELEQDPEMQAVAVTRHGKPVLAVMRWDVYEALVETLDLLGDEELMMNLRHSIQELATGQGIAWEQAKQELER